MVLATGSNGLCIADVAVPIDDGLGPRTTKQLGVMGCSVFKKSEGRLRKLDPVPRQLASPIVDLPVITG